jgi:hypothetical protein
MWDQERLIWRIRSIEEAAAAEQAHIDDDAAEQAHIEDDAAEQAHIEEMLLNKHTLRMMLLNKHTLRMILLNKLTLRMMLLNKHALRRMLLQNRLLCKTNSSSITMNAEILVSCASALTFFTSGRALSAEYIIFDHTINISISNSTRRWSRPVIKKIH